MAQNQPRRALLVIDLQQDFTSPTGAFKDAYVNADHIVSNLTAFVPQFRSQNGLVIWIKADYSNMEAEAKHLTRSDGDQYENVPMNDAFLSGTHKTFPLCIPGTDGAKFIPEVESLIRVDQDVIISKTYYSAFTDTNLSDLLKNVQEVHVCGLMTSVCVRATVTDAFFHGHKVFVWTDCLGYRQEKGHRKALSDIKQWYATLTTSKTYAHHSSTTASAPKPVLYFVNGSIPSWRVMMVLYEKGIDFEGKRLKVMCNPKQTKSPEFLAINPRGLTPTLVDTDGSIIAESLAILRYLEEYYPDTPRLMPVVKADHVKVLQRMQQSQNLVDIYETLEEIAFQTPKSEQLSHEDAIRKTLHLIDEELAFWEVYLTKTTFIACDQFTLADCAFYPVIAYLIHRGLNIDAFPLLKNYVRLVKNKIADVQAHPVGWKEKGGRVNVFAVVRNILVNSKKGSGNVH